MASSRVRYALTGAALLAAAGFAWGETASTRSKSLTIGDSQVLMQWSADWTIDGSTKDPKTVAFNLPDALAMRTIVSEAPPGPPVTNDTQLQELVTYMSTLIAPQSVEKNLQVQSLAGATVKGRYFCATDPKPKADEYRYLCQGALLVDGLVFTFTVLYNEPGKAESKKVLGALGTMQVAKTA
jgi:hypothetical protein